MAQSEDYDRRRSVRGTGRRTQGSDSLFVKLCALVSWWQKKMVLKSFSAILFKTMKGYIIVRVFIEWTHTRRIKQSPTINYIIPFIKSRHPVYEQETVFFNKVSYDLIIFNIFKAKGIERMILYHQFSRRFSNYGSIFHFEIVQSSCLSTRYFYKQKRCIQLHLTFNLHKVLIVFRDK